ncbi:MAG TPA: M1 family metallopeptidase [Candidatus Acidoferrum sp.]|nr:M1 family metallopeptidase [Candidatus Acidoferrum sp.]
MRRGLILLGVLCGFVCGAEAQRLPGNVKTEAYELTFTPNLEKATFGGEELIRVKLEKATKTITLNAAEVEFQELSVTAGGTKQKGEVSLDAAKEMATLTVGKEMPAGPAEIRIKYTGILNDKLRGFYLSETRKRRYAVTQFEPTDARRAFPSFDEPAYKATFAISLVIDKGDTAISNGTIVSDTPGPGEGKHTLKFSPTPKISTYLVAMMVGDFVCREGAADNIPVRVCAVPEKAELTGFALEAAQDILKYYDKYYSVKYPFKKLDVIAFPDFAAGAMENVAAITYRETLLIIDDKTASVDAHQAVADVLAHEMAHQWFGDLVTMKWWDDIWLNEGFATWMAWKPVEAHKPEWHEEQQEIQQTGGALSNDAIASVRAIRANADTPGEIQALFDGVAYGKAASVLRMVEAYAGPDVFQKGVNAYLEKHAYGNATAEDFWNQLTATSGKPVDKIMKTFTEQSGAPYVTVQSACGGGKTQVTLTQERYFADAAKMKEGSKEIWQIPVSLRRAGSKEVTQKLLTEKKQTFELPGCAAWVYANASGRGYFRSGYDAATLAKMSEEIETSFTPEERIHFLGDVWTQQRIGRLGIGDYLAVLEKMKGERSRAVVAVMMGRLGEIHDQIASAEDRPKFEAWVRDFLNPIATELGDKPVAGEPEERRGMRADVFATLAQVGRDPKLLARSREVAEQYMKDANSVEAAMAGNALAISALQGDADLYAKYLDRMKAAKAPEEYYAYFGALGSFSRPELVKRTFEFALGPDVKSQDLFVIFGPIGNPPTQEMGWELFKQNFPAILKKMDAANTVTLAGVAGFFCDAKERDDAQQFFAAQKLQGSERILRNAKDTVNACIELRGLQQRNLTGYLNR